MKPYQPDIILAHGKCDDGFAATWAARLRWPNIRTMYFDYGMDIPVLAGLHIILADFSWPLEKLQELAARNKSVIVLDHHETAEADLSKIAVETEQILEVLIDGQVPDDGTLMAYFDMRRSGAGLVWDFAHFGEKRPNLIQYVEDNDLYNHVLPNSIAFTNLLRSYPMDFAQWTLLNMKMETLNGYEGFMAEAKAVQRYTDARVAELVRDSYMYDLVTPNETYFIPVSNCPHILGSAVCTGMMEKYDRMMSATFSVVPDGKGGIHERWSVRSTKDGPNVSTICKTLGGGGHRNASGFLRPIR